VTKRKATDAFEEKFLSLYEKKTSIAEDEYYHFGQIVATKLRNLNNDAIDKMEVQIKILELLKMYQ